jgi:oligopeptide/dipeptide ABC transporter ATP-binding protein
MNAAIDRDFDAHVERIRDFLRIPSVSAADGDLRSTAAAVCELIEAAGGTAEVAEPGERRPTVIGVIDGPGPTVLRYGMYDVQPPGSGWTREPFAAGVEDGRIYARGAANSKAALAGSLLAFAGTRSPCRQVLLMEGEEELGSPRLGEFWAAHRQELRADYALDFDLAEGTDGSAPVPPRRQRTPLGGELPDPAYLPSGCRFHPRCPKRFEPCDQEDPPLFGLAEPGHEAACLLHKH